MLLMERPPLNSAHVSAGESGVVQLGPAAHMAMWNGLTPLVASLCFTDPESRCGGA